MRLFVALELPEAARAAAAQVLQSLRPRGQGIKWVAPANLHLTLKFLGETPAAALEGVIQALAGALAGQPALDLELAGCGAFPQISRPQVVWLGLDGQVEGLAGLARGLEAALEPLGFAPEGRPFKPHLTLGRLRRGEKAPPALSQALAGLAARRGPAFTAARVGLMESTLTPQGPIYRQRAVWELGAGPAC